MKSSYMNIRSKYKGGMVVKPSISGKIADFVIYAFVALFLFACIIPFWHVLMSSISDGKTLFGTSGLVLLPVGKINLDGFKLIFKSSNILRGYLNTVLYVGAQAVLGLVINTLAGYALSRNTKLKVPMTIIVLFTTMFNGGLIPTYMVIRGLGFVGTPLALIIPGCTNAFFIILSMNAFLGVPDATVESARIDGAGHLRVMFIIMLPQCMNLIAVTILNTVVMGWNAWLPASIYVPLNSDLWPLQLWVKELIAQNDNFITASNPNFSRYLIQYGVIIVATLPILLVFPFFIKRMESGVMTGAVKG